MSDVIILCLKVFFPLSKYFCILSTLIDALTYCINPQVHSIVSNIFCSFLFPRLNQWEKITFTFPFQLLHLALRYNSNWSYTTLTLQPFERIVYHQISLRGQQNTRVRLAKNFLPDNFCDYCSFSSSRRSLYEGHVFSQYGFGYSFYLLVIKPLLDDITSYFFFFFIYISFCIVSIARIKQKIWKVPVSRVANRPTTSH